MGKDRICKLAICLMLVISILALSFSVFADDVTESPPPIQDYLNLTAEQIEQMWESTGNYLVWYVLQSWGIDITVDETIEYNNAVRDTINQLVDEYLQTLPSVMSIYSWVHPWTWDRDFWGNFRMNTNMLQDLEAFAAWLRQKYQLTDNDYQVVNTTKKIGYITIYDFFDLYSANYYGSNLVADNWVQYYTIMHIERPDGLQVGNFQYFYWNDGDVVRICLLMPRHEQYYLENEVFYLNEYGVDTQIAWQHGYAVTTESWNVTTGTTGAVTMVRPSGYVPFVGTWEELVYLLDNGTLVTDHEIGIETEIVILPSNDPGYTTGDGMVIVDGEPDYQIIEFPDSFSVNNLPAVISPTTISDPDLNSVYQEITPFFRTFGGAIDTVRGIVMQLPVEVLSCLFALMGAIIIFGIIKIMREH